MTMLHEVDYREAQLLVVLEATHGLPVPLPVGDFYAEDYSQGRHALAQLAQAATIYFRRGGFRDAAELVVQLERAILAWPAPARELWPEVFGAQRDAAAAWEAVHGAR